MFPISGRRVWRAFLDKLFPSRRKHRREHKRETGSRPRLEALEDRLSPAVFGGTLPGVHIGLGAPISLSSAGSQSPGIISAITPVKTAAIVAPTITAPGATISTTTGGIFQATGQLSPVAKLGPPVSVGTSASGANGTSSAGGASGSNATSGAAGATGAASGSAGSSGTAGTSGTASTGGQASTGGSTSNPTGGIYVPAGQVTLPAVPVINPGTSGSGGQGIQSGAGTAGAGGASGSNSASASGANATSQASNTGGGGTGTASAAGQGGSPAANPGIYVPQGQLTLGASASPPPVQSFSSLTPVPTVAVAAGSLSIMTGTDATVTVPDAPPATGSDTTAAAGAADTSTQTAAAIPPSTNMDLPSAPVDQAGDASGGSYTLMAGSGSNIGSSTQTSLGATQPQTQSTDHAADSSAPTALPAPTTGDSVLPPTIQTPI